MEGAHAMNAEHNYMAKLGRLLAEGKLATSAGIQRLGELDWAGILSC